MLGWSLEELWLGRCAGFPMSRRVFLCRATPSASTPAKPSWVSGCPAHRPSTSSTSPRKHKMEVSLASFATARPFRRASLKLEVVWPTSSNLLLLKSQMLLTVYVAGPIGAGEADGICSMANQQPHLSLQQQTPASPLQMPAEATGLYWHQRWQRRHPCRAMSAVALAAAAPAALLHPSVTPLRDMGDFWGLRSAVLQRACVTPFSPIVEALGTAEVLRVPPFGRPVLRACSQRTSASSMFRAFSSGAGCP